ncbi:MAG TPA: hypothetical protein K8V84_04505 [Nocardiopsis listeri]|uniref:hypothetical protein n=1 Tax=Nocardiopsis listeri TaxID=53440 RepID=UPI001DD5F74C|nr:hypothetical protein [Nocardiopsis listeri]HJE57764.1 hypothetical protein [Nocardiopsis listeri]
MVPEYGGDPPPPYPYRPDVDHPLRASVGKTRARWEAGHDDLPAKWRLWRLWHPLASTRPEAPKEALRAGRIAPHTAVWPNEASTGRLRHLGGPLAWASHLYRNQGVRTTADGYSPRTSRNDDPATW